MGREQFSNTVKTEWIEGQDRDMRLLETVVFTDAAGRRWIAMEQSIINGADIPRFFWRVIGSPFVGHYRRPTVLHDVYCQNHLRPSKEVHKMFFEAMIADGVSEQKAEEMFFAVDTFGPDW